MVVFVEIKFYICKIVNFLIWLGIYLMVKDDVFFFVLIDLVFIVLYYYVIIRIGKR